MRFRVLEALAYYLYRLSPTVLFEWRDIKLRNTRAYGKLYTPHRHQDAEEMPQNNSPKKHEKSVLYQDLCFFFVSAFDMLLRSCGNLHRGYPCYYVT
jgi:hypothetical protein